VFVKAITELMFVAGWLLKAGSKPVEEYGQICFALLRADW